MDDERVQRPRRFKEDLLFRVPEVADKGAQSPGHSKEDL